MSKLVQVVELVDVAYACNMSHKEFYLLPAGRKQQLAQLVYSARIHKYELIDDLLPEDWD